jgi:hypothetical protein
MNRFYFIALYQAGGKSESFVKDTDVKKVTTPLAVGRCLILPPLLFFLAISLSTLSLWKFV